MLLRRRGFFVSCPVRNSVFHKHIEGFNQKLASLPGSIEGINGYPAFYLAELIRNPTYFLQIYAQLLEILIGSTIPPQNISLLDVGSGNGLLGLFARFCGVQKVILLEPDADFLKASEILSQHLGIMPDVFINSSFEEADLNDIPYVVGSDMIEHVYDLDIFAAKMSKSGAVRFVFSSASNMQNPFVRRRLEKIQYKDEMIGDPDLASAEKGVSGVSFLKIRQDIIKRHFPALQAEEIKALAFATRGKKQTDILAEVKRFSETGMLPVPAEGLNTCDPLTGSWTERLLSFNDYQELFGKHEFRVQFNTGFYNQWQPGFPGAVKKMLNKLITLGGFKISPYFVISGSKNQYFQSRKIF